MTDGGDRGRTALDRLLGGPDIAWLVERVRARILAAHGEPLSGVVQLRGPTAAQRAAAVRLVGPPGRAGAGLRVDLALVEEVLRRGPWPGGLADAVETLTGPVVDTSAERLRESTAWDAARDMMADVAAAFPGLAKWWDGWCAAGGLKRSARAEAARLGQPFGPPVGAELVRHMATVVAALPASDEPLAVFARRVLGDAHALDVSRPLGRLAAAVVGAAFGSPQDGSVRDAWAAGGVVMSAVASTVLCLGVPAVTGGPAVLRAEATAAVLEATRAARMPVVLTLDQVRSGGVAGLPIDATVYVCENPSVVEVVADRWAAQGTALDGRGPVLVCTWGQPSTAVVELLRILTAGGAACRYHGDFDWPGLRIAGALRDRIGWTPWRYTADDYVALAGDDALSRLLTGPPAASPWDPRLATAMAEHGRAIEEEAVVDQLAGDVLVSSGHLG
jgi:uncharacterized protein (TIGR02679 family)